MAQAGAQHLHELERDLRLAAHQVEEIAALDHHELAVGHGGRVGRARPAVQQGDFPENLALADQIEDGVLAVRGRHADLHRSGADRIEAVAGIALNEDGVAATDRARRRVGAQSLEQFRRDHAEQRMPTQQRELVGGRKTAPVLLT